jgi:hypothetical protein
MQKIEVKEVLLSGPGRAQKFHIRNEIFALHEPAQMDRFGDTVVKNRALI